MRRKDKDRKVKEVGAAGESLTYEGKLGEPDGEQSVPEQVKQLKHLID